MKKWAEMNTTFWSFSGGTSGTELGLWFAIGLAEMDCAIWAEGDATCRCSAGLGTHDAMLNETTSTLIKPYDLDHYAKVFSLLAFIAF